MKRILKIFSTHKAAVRAWGSPPEGVVAYRNPLVWRHPDGSLTKFGTPDPKRYRGLALTSVIIDEECDISDEVRAHLNMLPKSATTKGDDDAS